MENFTNKYSNKIKGVLSCYDRIVLTGTLPVLSNTHHMRGYQNQIRIFDYAKFAEPFRDILKSNAEHLARQSGVQIEYIRKGDVRKEAIIEAVIKKRGTHVGLVHILSVMEGCTTYKPWHGKISTKTFLKYDQSKCLTYYFYFIDEVLGLCYVVSARKLAAFWGQLYDKTKGFSAGFENKICGILDWKIQIGSHNIKPQYLYKFQDLRSFNNTVVGLDLKYNFTPNPEAIFFGRKIEIPSGKPIVSASYRRGLSTGDFTYDKLILSFEKTSYINHLGIASVKLEGGWINKPLPVGLLFTGFGAKVKGNPLIIPNYFQTMSPNEFVTDHYANIFLSHNFLDKLFNFKHFNPELVIYYSMGIGGLKNRNYHSEINLNSNRKPFIESGIAVNRILKVSYFNTFYINMGAAVFYRYGFYGKGAFGDNLYPRMTLTISSR